MHGRITWVLGIWLTAAGAAIAQTPATQPYPQRPVRIVVPYTNDVNDSKFSNPLTAFATGEDFYTYLKDTFEVLYREGRTQPKMMSVGLHMRLVGRPGRAAGLARFLDFLAKQEAVWVCRRLDIARHWHAHHRVA